MTSPPDTGTGLQDITTNGTDIRGSTRAVHTTPALLLLQSRTRRRKRLYSSTQDNEEKTVTFYD